MILCKNCDRRHPGCHDTCPIHKAELAEDHAKKAYLTKYKTMYESIDNERGRKVRKALKSTESGHSMGEDRKKEKIMCTESHCEWANNADKHCIWPRRYCPKHNGEDNVIRIVRMRMPDWARAYLALSPRPDRRGDLWHWRSITLKRKEGKEGRKNGV